MFLRPVGLIGVGNPNPNSFFGCREPDRKLRVSEANTCKDITSSLTGLREYNAECAALHPECVPPPRPVPALSAYGASDMRLVRGTVGNIRLRLQMHRRVRRRGYLLQVLPRGRRYNCGEPIKTWPRACMTECVQVEIAVAVHRRHFRLSGTHHCALVHVFIGNPTSSFLSRVSEISMKFLKFQPLGTMKFYITTRGVALEH